MMSSFAGHNVKCALCVCLWWFVDRKYFLLSFVSFPFLFFNLRMFSLLSCPLFVRVFVGVFVVFARRQLE